MEFKKVDETQDEVDAAIDKLLQNNPVELKKIKDNKIFLKKIEEHPIPVDVASIPVFGTSVDLNAILKNNIWDRTAYFVDMMCDDYAHMTLENLKKYLAKKRKIPNNILWLLLILMLVGVGVIVLILFLKGGGLGGLGI